jgi:hypothetical protein
MPATGCERDALHAAWRNAAAAVIVVLCAVAAQAATYPLDDSATIVQGGPLAMRWRSTAPGPQSNAAVDAVTVVNLSLNTQPWAGKRGRVYMRIAPQPVRFQVQWTTRGRLNGGRMESGQRVLIYDGVVPGPSLTDTLEVTVSADGRALVSAQQLRFSYEIEVTP